MGSAAISPRSSKILYSLPIVVVTNYRKLSGLQGGEKAGVCLMELKARIEFLLEPEGGTHPPAFLSFGRPPAFSGLWPRPLPSKSAPLGCLPLPALSTMGSPG